MVFDMVLLSGVSNFVLVFWEVKLESVLIFFLSFFVVLGSFEKILVVSLLMVKVCEYSFCLLVNER